MHCRKSRHPPKVLASSSLLPLLFLQNGSDLRWVQDWTQFHVARVRDIELLTGLSFYHDRISVAETLQLKTFLHTVHARLFSVLL